MNQRVLVLRDAVVKLTQMLAGKSIKVTQRGINAYVKADKSGRPVEVNLPYLPDNASEELCVAIQGFLDHEVAHVMFSDFSILTEANKLGIHSTLNILEDARIEKCMAQRFAGSGLNLTTTGKFFLDKYTTPTMKEAADAGDANKVIAVLMVRLLRAMSGQAVWAEFMKDKMHIMKPVYDKIADLQPKIEASISSQDCFDLAKIVVKRLRSEEKGKSGEELGDVESETDGKPAPKPGKTKPKKKPSPKKDEDEAKTEKKDKKEEPENKDAGTTAPSEPKKDPADEEEEKEEPTPSADTSDDEGEEEGEAAPSAGAADDEEGEEEPDEPASGEITSGEGMPGGEMEIGNASAMWEAIDKENANGFDSAMSNLISDASVKAAKDADYMVFTKDFDVIEPLVVGGDYNTRMLIELTEKVEHMVGPLQKDLERAIAARSMKSWESGRRSGRLHASNLSRLIVGDDRVFRRRHETTGKDVAVELVVDASGSMAGGKIHLATQSAYALSAVLERIGISNEVICFTTGNAGSSADEAAAAKKDEETLGRRFSRSESLYMPILKGFSERLRPEVKSRFGWLPNSNILRNNVDGECIEIAARRLMARRETSKVMIVLSDGAPNAYGDSGILAEHLKKVIGDVTKAGVKVVGIGIQSSAVTKFYPKNVVINNVEELPDRVIKELRHLLVS